MDGILGKKVGMTNIFDEEGRFVPVTLVEAGPCFVLGTKAIDKDGYNAVILGYGDKKESKVNLPQKKWFKKIKVSPSRFIKEIRSDSPPTCKTGDMIKAGIFTNGDYIDVTGTTIGKGFQGGVKRWHWRGGGGAHGSMFHRAPGSIGASSFPSRVHKGKTMPGHMGAARQTTQNLKIMSVDEGKNLLTVKGSIPGHKGSFVVIRFAKKKKRKVEAKKDDKVKKDEPR